MWLMNIIESTLETKVHEVTKPVYLSSLYSLFGYVYVLRITIKTATCTYGNNTL